MKFDVVVGNPPYQESVKSTNNNKAMPIYPDFYNLAKLAGTQYCLISPARFLFKAGASNKEWTEEMLSDSHLQVVFYERDSSKVFANTDIKGGVAVIHRDMHKNLGGGYRDFYTL